jgi:coenzyme PQQ precursor peptide PqqA
MAHGLTQNASHGRDERPRCLIKWINSLLRSFAMWTKPEYTEMRFGFEVTMYVFNR